LKGAKRVGEDSNFGMGGCISKAKRIIDGSEFGCKYGGALGQLSGDDVVGRHNRATNITAILGAIRVYVKSRCVARFNVIDKEGSYMVGRRIRLTATGEVCASYSGRQTPNWDKSSWQGIHGERCEVKVRKVFVHSAREAV
jgi:hypothetical protein